MAQTVKCLPAMWETWVWSLDGEDPLEKEMATHSSTLAWKIPWMEEPGRLQSMGLQRVRCDWANIALISLLWKWWFLQKYSELWLRQKTVKRKNNKYGVNWIKAVHGVAKSQSWVSNWTELRQEPSLTQFLHLSNDDNNSSKFQRILVTIPCVNTYKGLG